MTILYIYKTKPSIFQVLIVFGQVERSNLNINAEFIVLISLPKSINTMTFLVRSSWNHTR